jgi:hypothetical protein
MLSGIRLALFILDSGPGLGVSRIVSVFPEHDTRKADNNIIISFLISSLIFIMSDLFQILYGKPYYYGTLNYCNKMKSK